MLDGRRAIANFNGFEVVPEPGAWMLLASALAYGLVLRRRSGKK